MLRPRRESHHRNGITDLNPLQQTSATKSVINGHYRTRSYKYADRRMHLDSSAMACASLLMRAVLLMQGVVMINDLLTQITAVFVTIGGASNGSGTRTKTTGNYRG
jgi:hypothetical protein